MSALAQIMHSLGYQVQGSDKPDHFFTEDRLIEMGIPVLEFDEKNITDDLVIVRGTTFTEENNAEVRKALALNLKMYTYQQMVGRLTKKFETICVAGCHGKTTTTSMLAHVINTLKGANYLIGDGTGHADKDNRYFILEACEYKRHFLEYTPTYAIITNIELDHVDYFKDIDDVISAYTEYANKAEKMIISCGDDPYTHALEVNKPIFFYGLDDDNDIQARNVNYHAKGTSFEVFVEDNYYGFFDLPIYGKHMLLDALAVISICYYERMEVKEVNKIFKTYPGAKRRYSETKIGDIVCVDDYAHHPTEVRATIKATRQKYPDKKIITVFQPHTFTRTEEFADELAGVMNQADYSYVLDIHPAREKQSDYPHVTSDNIIDRLNHGEHLAQDEADKLLKWDNAVILFMSPNDLSILEHDYQEKRQNQTS